LKKKRISEKKKERKDIPVLQRKKIVTMSHESKTSYGKGIRSKRNTTFHDDEDDMQKPMYNSELKQKDNKPLYWHLRSRFSNTVRYVRSSSTASTRKPTGKWSSSIILNNN